MTDKSAVATNDGSKVGEPGTGAPVIVDLGSAKRGQIKQLTKGQGPLKDRVLEVIDSLRADGTVGASAQPVIVGVKKKVSSKNLLARLF